MRVYLTTTTTIASMMMAGCSGQIYHAPATLADRLTADISKANGEGNPLPEREVGVPYYPRINVITKTDTTTKNCEITTTYGLSTIVDTSRPQRIWYSPGFLESYTFNPTLTSDGGFLSANSISDPDQGKSFKNFAEGFTSIAGAVLKGSAFVPTDKGKRFCKEEAKVSFFQFNPSALPLMTTTR